MVKLQFNDGAETTITFAKASRPAYAPYLRPVGKINRIAIQVDPL
jgi:hypothetical protein